MKPQFYNSSIDDSYICLKDHNWKSFFLNYRLKTELPYEIE